MYCSQFWEVQENVKGNAGTIVCIKVHHKLNSNHYTTIQLLYIICDMHQWALYCVCFDR